MKPGRTRFLRAWFPRRRPWSAYYIGALSPGEKPFVKVGDNVGPNDTVCLVEVMKLFNSAKAGVSGTVRKILTENGTIVKHPVTEMITGDLVAK